MGTGTYAPPINNEADDTIYRRLRAPAGAPTQRAKGVGKKFARSKCGLVISKLLGINERLDDALGMAFKSRPIEKPDYYKFLTSSCTFSELNYFSLRKHIDGDPGRVICTAC